MYALNKITAEASDIPKIQIDDLLKITKYEHREEFLKFDYKKDCLDELIWPFFIRLSDNKVLCTVCKAIFVLSHGRSFTERGFFVYKDVVDDNMNEKSLISQRIVYDTIQSFYDGKVLDFQGAPELRKVFRLTHQKYKSELEDTRVAKN